jgi:hypothetical protein
MSTKRKSAARWDYNKNNQLKWSATGISIISSTARDESDSSGSDDSGAERDLNNDSGDTKT